MREATDKLLETREIEYIRHGGRPLVLRLCRTRDERALPVIIDIHGGAWCNGDLDECRERDELLAASGVAAIALNYRQAEDGYPTSLIDINYAIRWVKANAAELGLRGDRVGLCGDSSGGHLAMLVAMRPNDPRYAQLELPASAPGVDASVRCVVMNWPVINPLSRYRFAKRKLEEAHPPGWAYRLPSFHDRYWKTEDNMSEGNPLMALERGEKVCTPNALWIQTRPDEVHDYRDIESPLPGNEPMRFVANYLKAGGLIDLKYINFDRDDQRARQEALTLTLSFFHAQLVD
jgi:acetyl esterase